jgi:hypothetical protein
MLLSHMQDLLRRALLQEALSKFSVATERVARNASDQPEEHNNSIVTPLTSGSGSAVASAAGAVSASVTASTTTPRNKSGVYEDEEDDDGDDDDNGEHDDEYDDDAGLLERLKSFGAGFSQQTHHRQHVEHPPPPPPRAEQIEEPPQSLSRARSSAPRTVPPAGHGGATANISDARDRKKKPHYEDEEDDDDHHHHYQEHRDAVHVGAETQPSTSTRYRRRVWWYRPEMTRAEAEALLSTSGRTLGAFVVRKSAQPPADGFQKYEKSRSQTVRAMTRLCPSPHCRYTQKTTPTCPHSLAHQSHAHTHLTHPLAYSYLPTPIITGTPSRHASAMARSHTPLSSTSFQQTPTR